MNININLVLLVIALYLASTLTSGCRRPTPFKDWINKWQEGRKRDRDEAEQDRRWRLLPDDQKTEPDNDQRQRDRWRLFPKEEPCEA